MDLETVGGAAGATALVLGASKLGGMAIDKMRRKKPVAKTPTPVSSGGVWAYFDPHKPFDGFSEDAEPLRRPAVYLKGYSLCDARLQLTGKSFAWGKLPEDLHQRLENDLPEFDADSLRPLLL